MYYKSYKIFISMYVCMYVLQIPSMYACMYKAYVNLVLGKLDLELSMFSLASCITRVFATFRGNSTQKNIRLTKHLSAIVPPQVHTY